MDSNVYNGHDRYRSVTTAALSCLIWHGLPAALIVLRLLYTCPTNKHDFKTFNESEWYAYTQEILRSSSDIFLTFFIRLLVYV